MKRRALAREQGQVSVAFSDPAILHQPRGSPVSGSGRTTAQSRIGPQSQQRREGSCLIEEQRGPPEQAGWEGWQKEILQGNSFVWDYQGMLAS